MPDHRRHIDRQAQQQMDEQYEILPSSEILARLQKLVATYPTFATLTTTQEWFGLPRAGKNIDNLSCFYATVVICMCFYECVTA